QSLELVRAANGKVLTGAVQAGYRVIQANTADLVTAALQGVITHGTGTAANIGRPAAGKTGTAENYQDAWFCGYVPQLVTCVWVGYPHRELSMQYIEGYSAVFGGTIPASIWHDFMSVALANVPVESFPTAYDHGSAVSGGGYYQTTSPSYTPPAYTPPTATTTTTATRPASPPPPPRLRPRR